MNISPVQSANFKGYLQLDANRCINADAVVETVEYNDHGVRYDYRGSAHFGPEHRGVTFVMRNGRRLNMDDISIESANEALEKARNTSKIIYFDNLPYLYY